MLASMLAVLAACSGKPSPARHAAPADSSSDPKNAPMTLSAEQRGHLTIVPVTTVVYRPTVHAPGTVAFDGNISTQVLAPISGPVVRVLVDVGTAVHKGDPLAVLSSPDFATAVSAYRKALAASTQARDVAERNAELYKADGIAKRDVDQSLVEAESAAADRDAARQQLQALGVDAATLAALEAGKHDVPVQAFIHAPLDGTVVERLINPGQLLQAGTTPCFTVADVSRMWVLANVFESDLAYVARGDHAEVTGAAIAQPIKGITDYVSAMVDPGTRATSVRIEVPNVGHVLKKDMYVETAIQSSRTVSGILIPVSAVLRDDDNLPFVFIETTAGSFARRQVTLGNRMGDRYEVRSGLADGEHVIAEGGLFLEFAQNQ